MQVVICRMRSEKKREIGFYLKGFIQCGYGTIRAKTSSSLGRFDRDDSRKKSNGTVRAEKLGRFAENQKISEDFFSEIAQEIFKISSSRHLNEVYYC